MNLHLNGHEVESSGSVLDVCSKAGVAVPTLCFDARTSVGGHCRACMVQVDGRMVAACSTPARAGTRIETDTEELRQYRRDLAELVASEADAVGRAGELLAQCGADGTRYPKLDRSGTTDASHPYLRIDLSRCVHCRLCVRACAELAGQYVFAMTGRGADSAIGWGGSAFAATECVSCGACASACPSGAITDVDRLAPKTPDERVVTTTCGYCGVGCGLDVRVDHETIRAIDGAAGEPNHGHLCVKGRYAHTFVRHPDRLTTPLVRDGDRLVPASWDEAYARIAREFARLRGHVAVLSSARCTNEENYLAQKWARTALATNDVDCCARVCHAPSAAGLRGMLGAGAATNSYADVDRADLLFVVGSNTTASHPVVGQRVLRAVMERRARLVVIDPRRTELAAAADVHLALRPGTNVPLLQSIAHVIVAEELVDTDFVAARTEGFDELRDALRAWSPEATESVTGVDARLVRRAARSYATAAAPMQMHGLGVTEHHQGTETVRLLCNLALLVGAIGHEGVGVNPLRGQNNVQGAADMGCQPDLLTGYAPVADERVRERIAAVWGSPLPGTAGRTLPRIYDAIEHGDVRGLFILGEDVVQTDPEADRVRERLSELECFVVCEIFRSATSELAHVVLPGASFLEKDGTFTNGERRVRRVRQVLPPPGDARPDWRILLELMAATGAPQPFTSPESIWDEVRRVAPAFDRASYAAIDAAGLQWPVTASAPHGSALLHRSTFATAGEGKARFAIVEFVPSPNVVTRETPLTLVTGRVLEHYNSGSMTRRTRNAELVEADLLEIHPDDARPRGIVEGAAVRVTSASGAGHFVARVTSDVQPGVVFASFHFLESATNELTSGVVDRVTDCPEYKVTPVQVARA
ncbi:MAG: formate dehydrogenase subunit alpha [Planctomycetes bacterium]|nr:formate dehydrogenase subunit alpha [Planctomycetota bacterium]